MADKVRGITIELNGDASGLTKSLKGVNSEVSNTQKQLKDVEKLLKLDPKNTELLRQKHELLGKSISANKEKLDELHKIEKQMKDDPSIDKHSEQWMAVQREIVDTEERTKNLKKEYEKTLPVFRNIESELDNWADKTGKIADKTAGISRAAQGVLATATGVAAAAVKSYAENEQLIGGIETLYGESADQLKRYANDAYKTAGLSANQYMELSTSFAASLVQSLGSDTKKAADYANKAIVDMSDNANKMGSDIESLQTAYQGFAKGQYTLLDNLKLGYGGTATEMARLLNDSGVLGNNVIDTAKDVGDQLAEVGLNQIIDAIHVIQTEMGITGTTAAEAEKTISGSFESAKSAVGNLITGLSQENADIDALTKNVVDSVLKAINNILPVLKNLWDNLPKELRSGLIATGAVAAFSPIFNAISEIASAISKLQPIFSQLTSRVITAGKAVGTAVVAAGKAVASLFSQIVAFVAANPITLVIAAVVALVALIATKGDEIQALLQKVDDFLQGIFARDWTEVFGPVLGEALNGFFANVKNIWDAIKQILDGVIDFIRGVFTGDWKRAWEGIKEIFGGIFRGLGAIVKAPLNGIITMLNGIISGINFVIRGLNKLPNVNIGEVGKIPYLAKGGILSRGSAIVGEAGPEMLTVSGGRAIVQPLTNNTTTNHNLGGLTLNVYGAPGQDVNDLADRVMDLIQQATEQRGAVFA